MSQVGRLLFFLSHFIMFSLIEDSFADGANLINKVIQVKSLSGETILVDVTVADTPLKRMLGLSNKEELQKNKGLLLDFTREIKPKIWMKDTRFSLDILFIKSDGKITQIAHRADPYSLEIIHSQEKVRYVLEIKGGEARFNHINIGDQVYFIKP